MPDTGRLFVAGSINQDIIIVLDRQPQKGESLLGKSLEYAPGGKGANQAVAAAKTQAPTQLLAAVGDDEFGKSLTANLKSQGVDVSGVVTKKATPSGTAIVMVAENDNSIIVIGGANAKLTPEDISAHISEADIGDGDLVLAQCETPKETSLRFFESARASGAKSILNPSPATDMSPELLLETDYLIVNEVELATLLNQREDFEAGKFHPSFEHLLELRNSYDLTAVVCTLGSKGILAINEHQTINLEALPVEIVDTTGAGDTFCGVFASSLLRGADFKTVLAYANLAGSMAVRSLGAQNAMPTLSQLKAELESELKSELK